MKMVLWGLNDEFDIWIDNDYTFFFPRLHIKEKGGKVLLDSPFFDKSLRDWMLWLKKHHPESKFIQKVLDSQSQ